MSTMEESTVGEAFAQLRSFLRGAGVAGSPRVVRVVRPVPFTPPRLPAIDFSKLNPGIRKVVALLRENGFDTCDSGDGETREHECDRLGGYVVVAIRDRALDRLSREACRLLVLLISRGIKVAPIGSDEKDAVTIQASYDPVDGSALIDVVGIHDRMLPDQPAGTWHRYSDKRIPSPTDRVRRILTGQLGTVRGLDGDSVSVEWDGKGELLGRWLMNPRSLEFFQPKPWTAADAEDYAEHAREREQLGHPPIPAGKEPSSLDVLSALRDAIVSAIGPRYNVSCGLHEPGGPLKIEVGLKDPSAS